MTHRFLQANRYKFFTIGAIGTFMGTLDGSILNVALPTIAADLNCEVDVIAWVVLAYALTVVSLLMVFGAWTERKGYAFAYKFGYAFFLTGSIICALSGSFETLVAGRVVQATGAAVFQAIGTGMIAAVFPPEERGKGIGLMVMMVSAGLMAGPPLGGLLLDIWPWPSLFIINIPIGAIGLGLCFVYFRDFPKPEGKRAMKLGGAVAMSLSLLSGMLSLSLLNDYSLSDPRILGLWAFSAASLAAFFVHEAKPARALIGLDMMRNSQFNIAISTMLMIFIAIAGVLILVPFYLQNVRGYEPKTIGLFLILLPVTMFIVAPLSGRLSDRVGYRLLTTGGILALALGLYMLAGVGVDSSDWLIIRSLVMIGIGVGVCNTPNASAAMTAVAPDQRAITSGIISTTRNIGMALGVALSTALFAYFQSLETAGVDPSLSFVANFRRVILISVGVSLLGALISAVRKNRL